MASRSYRGVRQHVDSLRQTPGSYLVLVNNDTVELIVKAVLAIALFHDLVDIEVGEAGA